jgi:hypothetical protein
MLKIIHHPDTGCEDCPLSDQDDDQRNGTVDIFCNVLKELTVYCATEEEPGGPAPAKCPLRAGPVTVEVGR